MMEQTTLTALVVYESYFGNTRTIAHAVAEGLRLEGVAPTVQEVSAAVPTDVTGYHLLVVGGPTHAFGLSRESTRADAENHDHMVRTRAEKVRHLPMSAAQAAGRMLKRRGYTLVRKPTGFVVQDVEGPLGCGETERAIEWGRTVGREAQLHRAASALDHAHPARGRTP